MNYLKTFILLGLFLFLTYQAKACTCFSPPISKILNQADAIFIGKVVGFDISYNIEYRKKLYLTEFEVVRYWRGDSLKFKNLPKYVTVAQAKISGGCSFQYFEIDKKYLIYAEYENGFLFAPDCHMKVLNVNHRYFKQDVDSLKILGFDEIKPIFEDIHSVSEDTFSIIKEKEKYIQANIDSSKRGYENKIKQLTDNQLDIWERRIYWIFIFLLLVYLIWILIKKKE